MDDLTREENGAAKMPVTVVVPVYNGEGTIDVCVRSLLSQDYPPELTKLLVVDNASCDLTRTKLEAHGEQIEIIEATKRGASAARNAGILAAETDLIAFMDADCVADPSWLRELVQHHVRYPRAALIGGRIDTYRAETPVQLFLVSHFAQERSIADRSTPSVITANMLARRSDLKLIGLFDENVLRGQDIDLSFRAAFDHKMTFSYADAAIVRHIHVATVRGLFVKGTQHGLALYYLLGKHPEKIGLTRQQRLLGRRTYTRILKNLWWTVRPVINRPSETETVTRRQHAFFQAVFDIGKQVGLLSAMLTFRGRSRDESPGA